MVGIPTLGMPTTEIRTAIARINGVAKMIAVGGNAPDVRTTIPATQARGSANVLGPPAVVTVVFQDRLASMASVRPAETQNV